MHTGISVLKAYELLGAAQAPQANVGTLHGVVTLLSTLDLSAPEAEAIVRQLATISTALRFLLDNPNMALRMAGMDTSAQGCVVCALAFGKEEADSPDAPGDSEQQFYFTSENLRLAPTVLLSVFSGTMATWTPTLPPYFVRPAVALCISDTNKQRLLESASESLLQLLLEALLLDPEHPRQNQPEVRRIRR